jgi:hypothetical protein
MGMVASLCRVATGCGLIVVVWFMIGRFDVKLIRRISIGERQHELLQDYAARRTPDAGRSFSTVTPRDVLDGRSVDMGLLHHVLQPLILE